MALFWSGEAIPYTRAGWGKPQTFVPNDLGSMSCAGPRFCVVTAGQGVLICNGTTSRQSGDIDPGGPGERVERMGYPDQLAISQIYGIGCI